MAAKTFKGGIHPPERKEGGAASASMRVPLPARLVISLSQHFGPPLTPVVSVGDRVVTGQVIARGDGPLSMPLHASACGSVAAIEPRALPNNSTGTCVVIDTGADQSETDFMFGLDPFSCERSSILERVREAGIAGMGGAGFPCFVKLNPPPSKPISLVIANGAECEPYLTTDETLMAERPDRVVTGLFAAMRALDCKEGAIALETNKSRFKPLLEETVARLSPRAPGLSVSVRLLKTKYPQGGEKMLIAAITGKEVPSGGLPADVGCVVHNIATLAAIADACIDGKPSIERRLTLAGGALKAPRNVIAPIGTVVDDLVARPAPASLGADAGTIAPAATAKTGTVAELSREADKIVFGGPMMGTAVATSAIPIQKTTSAVLFLAAGETGAEEEGHCIRCGRCFRACGCRLSPALMNAALVAGDFARAEDIGLMDCIECGGCSYICPARIRLVQRFRVGKADLRALKQKEGGKR